jgi:glycosyltransferase involved in cell wall biosynthesis
VVRHGSDIIVAQSPYEGFAGACAKRLSQLLLRRPIALVVESHGDFAAALFLQRRSKQRGVYAFLMRHSASVAIANADAFRAVSAANSRQLSEIGVRRPIVEFPTWSDLDVFFEAGRDRTCEGTDILYVGRLTPLKGVHHLVAAFGKIMASNNSRLLIVGRNIDPAYTSELTAQVAALGISTAVRFMGELPQSQVAAQMAAARVVVLPSYSEGLPRALFEAMATGTPIIGTDVGGTQELIDDGVNGFLVKPGDEEALIARLKQVVADDDLCKRLGAAGREKASKRFSTEHYFAEYRRLFQIAREEAGR